LEDEDMEAADAGAARRTEKGTVVVALRARGAMVRERDIILPEDAMAVGEEREGKRKWIGMRRGKRRRGRGEI